MPGIWEAGEFPFVDEFYYYYYTEYTVCYCDDQKDMTLEIMGDEDTTCRPRG